MWLSDWLKSMPPYNDTKILYFIQYPFVNRCRACHLLEQILRVWGFFFPSVFYLFAVYSTKKVYKTTLCIWTVSCIVKCIIIFFTILKEKFILNNQKRFFLQIVCLILFINLKRVDFANLWFFPLEITKKKTTVNIDVILEYESRLNKENKWKILNQFYKHKFARVLDSITLFYCTRTIV